MSTLTSNPCRANRNAWRSSWRARRSSRPGLRSRPLAPHVLEVAARSDEGLEELELFSGGLVEPSEREGTLYTRPAACTFEPRHGQRFSTDWASRDHWVGHDPEDARAPHRMSSDVHGYVAEIAKR